MNCKFSPKYKGKNSVYSPFQLKMPLIDYNDLNRGSL